MENIGIIHGKSYGFKGFDRSLMLVDAHQRRKIRIVVLSVHVGLVLLLLCWSLVSSFFARHKPAVIKVNLVSPPSDLSKVDAPKPVSPPSPAPEPAPAPALKKPVAVKPPEPKPAPKKSNLLRPEDIKISDKVVRNDPAPPAPVVATPSAKDIERQLTAARNSVRVSSPQASAPAARGNVSRNYFDQVSAVIYQTWRQPLKSELGGRLPTVDVEFSLSADGKVESSRIIRRSGIAAMDSSAAELLANLKMLPPPPSGSTKFTVTLEIIGAN
ncbi:MAG: TonB family protein [Victivallales bacterium]|nr:TonB family protein [Victivallales bacterium]